MGSGYKDFAPGDVLTAADVDGYLMRQTVMTFADATARDTALSGVLDEGMVAYLEGTNRLTFYDGSAWQDAWQATNSGLVLVKTETVGSGVASVTVSDAFSSTFDNYRILVNGVTLSQANVELWLQLGASNTGYYYAFVGADFATGTATGGVFGNNDSKFVVGWGSNVGNPMTASCDLLEPQKAGYTTLLNATRVASAASRTGSGYHGVATAYTAFTLTPNGGTLTGGTIRVYGYNNG